MCVRVRVRVHVRVRVNVCTCACACACCGGQYRYPGLTVLSVVGSEIIGPDTDFSGAGSTTWQWRVEFLLNPFEVGGTLTRFPTSHARQCFHDAVPRRAFPHQHWAILTSVSSTSATYIVSSFLHGKRPFLSLSARAICGA